MRIELQAPYDKDYEFGTITTGSDNRQRITLWGRGEDGKRTRAGTSYARYKMSVKLGRYLEPHECVDHEDEDKTNDDIDNLKLTSDADNIRKNKLFLRARREEAGIPVVTTVNCDYCGTPFERETRKIEWSRKNNQRVTCSRSCRGKLPDKS